MFVFLWSALAFGQTCPDLGDQVKGARALFDDAELQQAKLKIAEAYDAIGCQERVVSTEELLSLYRLDGLVSLSLNDRKGATYATIRAVAANHEDGGPPADFGPDLADEYETWADRLGEALIYVRVAGGGTVYVDGRGLDASRFLQVAEGEHLVQVQLGEVVSSEVLELVENHVVVTGEPGPNPVLLPEEDTSNDGVPVPVPVPLPLPVLPDPDPNPTVAGRRRPAAFFVTGILSAGLGGAAIYWAGEQEKKFDQRKYTDNLYGGCLRGQDCYASARARVIKGDADLVNAGYGTGYGLCAVGA